MADEPDRSIIFDFGMHEGEDTEFYLACGADVIAFEANPSLVESNAERFAAEIESGRLKIVEGAIVAPDFRGSEQNFYIDTRNSSWGTTFPQWVERNSVFGSHTLKVTVTPVDLKAILSETPRILYAKIDIEGADPFVIDTFKAAGARPEYVSIESSKLSLQAVAEEIERLQDLGYSRFAAVQQATVPGSRVRGRALDGAPLDYRFRRHASGPFGPYVKQDYKTAGEVIDDYRAIFRAYARFGDRSPLMRYAPSRLATAAVNTTLLRLFRTPLCGWYDTHATL